MAVGSSLRRMLPLDVQVSLRNAEKDFASWRNSPLRPLIEERTTSLDETALGEIREQVNAANAELVGHAEVVATASRISDRLAAIAGEQHDVPLTFGLAPMRLEALLRGLRLLIDSGARGIPEASLGKLRRFVVGFAREHEEADA